MDNKLILNRIIEAYSLKNDSELASFLGITPQNLSNWRAKNTLNWRILFTKCVNISFDWLITGEGNMLKSAEKSEKNGVEIRKKQPHNVASTTQNSTTVDTLVAMLAAKDEQIAARDKQITTLLATIDKLHSILENHLNPSVEDVAMAG